MLSIVIDEADLEKRPNQLINDIINFNKEHVTNYHRKGKANIPEEPRYISSRTPTGFINGQD